MVGIFDLVRGGVKEHKITFNKKVLLRETCPIITDLVGIPPPPSGRAGGGHRYPSSDGVPPPPPPKQTHTCENITSVKKKNLPV